MKHKAIVIAVFIALTACSAETGTPRGSATRPPAPAGTPTQSISGTPPRSTSGTPGSEGIPAALVGTWASKDGDLVLRLDRDGTFEEDLNGTRAAYKGSYVVREKSFHLSADNGATAEGSIAGDFHHLELSGYQLWR
ncbi:Atu4866 domain-containing protein [Streptomyces sp. AC550_RSS872]|uniref:Atu4866 domain-containing protein n=1 Tax=Streptomyces sp. AC550_RSS872 TaxID=2823689 RepID=UPI001C2566BB|nr:Atu4866 domain-containing protein [Streptomyces sp. AC550_RSS872]